MVKKKKEEEKIDKKKIVIIILIILFLLSSCGLATRFLGKMGDKFWNHDKVEITENEKEIVKNKDLTFEFDHMKVTVGKEARMKFYHSKIEATKFTCTSSDPKVLTCIVEGDEVVITPLKPGKATITLKTETEDKIYIATSEIEVVEEDKYISLSKTTGIINLAENPEEVIKYKLIGISGKLKATSKNVEIATVKVVGDKIIVTGHKVGKTEILIELTYEGKIYREAIDIIVIDEPDKPVNGTETEEPNKPDVEVDEKVLLVKDVPLFRDIEYFEKYGKDKPIAPGSNGKYTLEIVNKTSHEIKINSLILKEDTICVEEGCLNLGYIVKDDDYLFSKNGDYQTLNEVAQIINGSHNEAKIDIDPITIAKGATHYVTVHWKWLESINTDELDTAIGNEAAKGNNTYKLNLEFTYTVEKDD